jgi:SET and MYND domain-containing protein
LEDDAVSQIDKLCTNFDKQSPEFLDWCRSFAELFLSHFSTQLGVTFDELVRLMCIVRANSLGFPFNEQATLGWSLECSVSMLNHSCEPNCAITLSSQRGCMEVRTVRRVKAGEELTISYIDMLDPANVETEARRLAIMERYRFMCDCPRCTGVISS